MYGPFTNEKLVGKAIRDRRDRVVVATKFGNMRGEQGEFLAESRFEFESPEECMEDALKHAADRERSAAR